MKHLVIYCVPGKNTSTEHLYRNAISDIGDYDWVAIDGPGFSSAKSVEALKYVQVDPKAGSKEIFTKLRETHNLDDKYLSVILITFSAGYGVPRVWFEHESCINFIDTYLAVDSIHGTHALDNVSQFVNFAKKKKCFILHTDVEPYSYASTTDVANHIKDRVGPRVETYHIPAENRSMKEQHIHAFVEAGPQFLKDTVVPYVVSTYGKGMKEPGFTPDYNLSLPERCLQLCKYEMDRGVRGNPLGSHKSPSIADYFSGAIRLTEGRYKGKNLGIAAANWCAACQGWVEAKCRLPNEKEVIPWTYSGAEIRSYARSKDTWLPADSMVGKDLRTVIRPGDICIMQRGTGWTTHTARVLEVQHDSFKTIGGNEGDQWKITNRSLVKHTSRPVLGFVIYPRDNVVNPVDVPSIEPSTGGDEANYPGHDSQNSEKDNNEENDPHGSVNPVEDVKKDKGEEGNRTEPNDGQDRPESINHNLPIDDVEDGVDGKKNIVPHDGSKNDNASNGNNNIKHFIAIASTLALAILASLIDYC